MLGVTRITLPSLQLQRAGNGWFGAQLCSASPQRVSFYRESNPGLLHEVGAQPLSYSSQQLALALPTPRGVQGGSMCAKRGAQDPAGFQRRRICRRQRLGQRQRRDAARDNCRPPYLRRAAFGRAAYSHRIVPYLWPIPAKQAWRTLHSVGRCDQRAGASAQVHILSHGVLFEVRAHAQASPSRRG